MHSHTFLRQLGVVGWGAIEPVLLAALATESPLLLVGPHGTAKSLLLERMAEALHLRFRHYNASTINFDDLAGFPVPDGDAVRYLRTPTDAWDAEAIFVDELSRCRPDLQNRLFPLIHERRLQGRRLERLRFRWAAMNPPPAPDADPLDALYLGAEPLDAALADRFPWVVQVPEELAQADRRALIAGPAPSPGAGEALVAQVDRVRGRLATTRQVWSESLVDYVDAVGLALAHAGLPLSNRRLRMLHDNLVAVLATGAYAEADAAVRCALTWSLPQRAGRPLTEDEEEAVLKAHAAAQALVRAGGDELRRALLAEEDPIARVALVRDHEDEELLAATVLDARAALDPAERLALAERLFPLLAETRPTLPAVVFEALAQDLEKTSTLEETSALVQTDGPRFRLANEVGRAAASLGPEDRWIRDVLWAAYKEDLDFRPDHLVRTCRRVAAAFPTLAELAEEVA